MIKQYQRETEAAKHLQGPLYNQSKEKKNQSNRNHENNGLSGSGEAVMDLAC
jgi:hypothetical protein